MKGLYDIVQIAITQVERKFNVNETLLLISHNKPIYWSWGVEKRINIRDGGLLIKVKGRKFKGFVNIVLAWDDLYKVHLIKNNGEVLKTLSDIYFDCLVEIIDNEIETN
jgi:hypothetical protein